MARQNPEIDYVAELLKLREIYVRASPQLRWEVIVQRLAQQEIGAVKLVTVVSAVEALARALLLEIQAKDVTQRTRLYKRHKGKESHLMIDQLFRELGLPAPNSYFAEDTWPLFKHAVNFRNLVVHECTYLGRDKYISLISACEEVLSELVRIGRVRVSD